MMIVFRERAEFEYEHVVEVDGEHFRIVEGDLLIRGMDDVEHFPAADGSDSRSIIATATWHNAGRCWEIETQGRTAGVYQREATRSEAAA